MRPAPRHALLPPILLLMLAGSLPPVAAEEVPAVPLIPEEPAVDVAQSWTHAISYSVPCETATIITLRLPEQPVDLKAEAPTDEQGFVWHAALPELGGYANIQFWNYPPPLDADPMNTYRSITPFHLKAVALANKGNVLEVETPVEIGDQVLKGLVRVWVVSGCVVEAGVAIPENSDSVLRNAAWTSLRMAMEPLVVAPPADEPVPAS